MSTLLAVAFGGAIGALMRYMAGEALKDCSIKGIAIGTLLINMTGSLILGWFLSLPLPENSVYHFFAVTGICGAFTTFSTFMAEAISYGQKNQFGRAALYVSLTVLVCVTSFAIGFTW